MDPELKMVKLNDLSLSYKTISLSKFTTENTPSGWKPFFEKAKPIIDEISKSLSKFARHQFIIPSLQHIYRPFYECSLDEVKVCLIGMDPYPNPNNTMGLCFSAPSDQPIPASLRVIYKKLEQEGFSVDWNNPDLTKWAKQGILMINAALTVEAGRSGAHSKLWRDFTKQLVRHICNRKENMVWIAFGGEAKRAVDNIDTDTNLVLTGYHPSPAHGCDKKFYEGRYFKAANEYLEKHGKSPIDW